MLFYLLSLTQSIIGPVNAGQDIQRSVVGVLSSHRAQVENRLLPRFRFAGAQWPPDAVRLLAIKESKAMELWVLSDGAWRHIRDYPIKGMSGGPGPKLREGDLQVPEGLYRVALLNPNSAFHLSLKLDYPNAFDREMAARDGRRDLGGDIFIHGNRVSRGCLAMGDRTIEDLFVLTALVGKERVSVLITPRDFRIPADRSSVTGEPEWRTQLYHSIATEMQGFDPASR